MSSHQTPLITDAHEQDLTPVAYEVMARLGPVVFDVLASRREVVCPADATRVLLLACAGAVEALVQDSYYPDFTVPDLDDWHDARRRSVAGRFLPHHDPHQDRRNLRAFTTGIAEIKAIRSI